MKTKFSIIILLFILMVNCKNETKLVEPETKEISLIESSQLKLNNGEKWIANIETHEGVRSMDSIIRAFKTVANKDYSQLGESLSKQTSYIIKKCDMKGEPHDQLHVVLVPMLDDITVFKDVDNDKSKLALENLEGLISKYFNHFKL